MATYHEYLEREPIPEIKALRPRAKDSIAVCDVGGLVGKMREIFAGRPHHLNAEVARLESGDLSGVARADEFLRRLEDEQFMSKSWQVVSDVVGSLPDVSAMIAGHPLDMRRRMRTRRPQGPLVLFLETTGSGSTMNGAAAMRGSVMLALARVLAGVRPVELYVCTTYGQYDTMNAVLCKVETLPLDLARACAMLTELQRMANLGNVMIRHFRRNMRDPTVGSWSYGTPDLERRYCGEIFRRFLAPDSDIVYVPAAFSYDLSLTAAYEWLKRMLKKYGGDSVVREDDEVDPDTGFREF